MRSKWLWAALALVAVLGITTAASATTRDLITGKQIASHTINSKHLVNHTIQKHDLSSGLIKSLHGAKGPTGPAGPRGATGPTGPQGATGPQGPSGVVSGQRGMFILSPNTTKVLLTNGPLSLTGTCTLTAGTLSISINDVSTVGNWIYFSTLEAAAGTELNNYEDDFGWGIFNGGNAEFNFMAPDGSALRGQYAFGVNWPSAGQCYVSVVGIPSSWLRTGAS